MFSPFRLLQALRPTQMPDEIPDKIHDGTASSFLNALVNSGDNLTMDSINAILSSFSNLNHTEQDKVIESPKYWNFLAKHCTDEDLEDISRRNVDKLREDLETVIYGVGTRKTAGVKDDAARLLATIPDDGDLFQWTRALVCKEDSKHVPVAEKAAGSQVNEPISEGSRSNA